MAREAKAIITLRDELNAAYPDRPKGADGTWGDARHQATKSDHNPTAPHPGVVTAFDITTAPFTDWLAERFRQMAAAGDKRIKYVIYKGRITTRDLSGWKPYTGYSQHFDHIHLSVSNDPAQYDRTDPWHITEEDDVTEDDRKAIAKLVAAELRPELLRLAQFLAGKENSVYNEGTVKAPAPKA